MTGFIKGRPGNPVYTIASYVARLLWASRFKPLIVETNCIIVSNISTGLGEESSNLLVIQKGVRLNRLTP